MNKIILKNKPFGIVSNKLNIELKKKYKCKIGYAGTLDPYASGVMVFATNKALKFLRFLKNEKGYVFSMQFGITTPSMDLQTEICEKNEIYPTKLELENVISSFDKKTISQIPNKFSALKINGEKAYKLARKNIEFELKSRLVEIFSIKLISYQNNIATIEVLCSQGTYIRTLAEDIAKKLKTIACVTYLNRINDHSLKLNFEEDEKILEVFDVLKPIYNQLEFNDAELNKLKNGVKINKTAENGLYLAMKNNEFFGIVNCERGVVFSVSMVLE